MAKPLALCRVVESNSQRHVTFSLKGMPVMSCSFGHVVDDGGDFLCVTASGLKGEGHETVTEVESISLELEFRRQSIAEVPVLLTEH